MAREVARRSPASGRLGAAALAVVLGIALLSPLAGYPVGADVDMAARSQGPSAAHWFGTDHLGRDVFWRTLLASRAFAGPGLLAAFVTAAVGVPLGAFAGWTGGSAATGVRACLGAVAAIPPVVLVVLGCARFGAGGFALPVLAGIAGVPSLAEAVRARIERLRVDEFVLASRAHGLSDARILAVHLVGVACGRTIARKLVEGFAGFVVLECTLSYLGVFGVPEPVPSWGNMLAFEWGRGLGASFLAPALALWCTVCATVLAARVFAEVDDG